MQAAIVGLSVATIVPCLAAPGSAPDIRIMCVTYQSNGMAIGDRVIVKGEYLRRDANHVLLDLCLPNRPEQ
jgi:hypothetical protein